MGGASLVLWCFWCFGTALALVFFWGWCWVVCMSEEEGRVECSITGIYILQCYGFVQSDVPRRGWSGDGVDEEVKRRLFCSLNPRCAGVNFKVWLDTWRPGRLILARLPLRSPFLSRPRSPVSTRSQRPSYPLSFVHLVSFMSRVSIRAIFEKKQNSLLLPP